VAIDNPHDSRPRMACNTAAKSSAIALRDGARFRLGDKNGSLPRFIFLLLNFRNPETTQQT